MQMSEELNNGAVWDEKREFYVCLFIKLTSLAWPKNPVCFFVQISIFIKQKLIKKANDLMFKVSPQLKIRFLKVLT